MAGGGRGGAADGGHVASGTAQDSASGGCGGGADVAAAGAVLRRAAARPTGTPRPAGRGRAVATWTPRPGLRVRRGRRHVAGIGRGLVMGEGHPWAVRQRSPHVRIQKTCTHRELSKKRYMASAVKKRYMEWKWWFGAIKCAEWKCWCFWRSGNGGEGPRFPLQEPRRAAPEAQNTASVKPRPPPSSDVDQAYC